MAGRIAYYGGIVTDGLVLHLDAAKRDSYPGSGTVWRDLSGNGNNGTLVNGPAFDRDSGNGSLVFDGVDDYAFKNNIDLGQNGGIDYWFRFNQFPTEPGSDLLLGQYNSYILYSNNNTALNQLYHFMYYNNTSEGLSSLSPGFISNIVLGKWYNSVVAWDENGGFQSYLDGVQRVDTIASSFDSWRNNFSTLTLGGYRSETETSVIKCYSKHLISTEVLQNFNAQRSRFGI